MDSFNANFYGAAAAAIPVFVLAAVVDLRGKSRGISFADFLFLTLQLAIAGVGEVAAFRTIYVGRAEPWETAGVIAGLAASGVFLAGRILLNEATTKARRVLLGAVLLLALIACIYWIITIVS
jgi:hypothetical protein